MALIKEITFKNNGLSDVTGEYWRISRIFQDRNAIEIRPPTISLELWLNKTARESGAANPVWTGIIIMNDGDLVNSLVSDIYLWLKENYSPLSEAEDA